MPSKRPWRIDEPARNPAHRLLSERISTQDSCITWLLVELRALQKRVDKLEQHNAHTAANMLRAAYERVEDEFERATMTERLAFSIKEVAEQFGVSQDTVKRAIAKGHLPIRKIGRLTRIDRQDRDEWLLAGRSVGRNKAGANK